MTLVTSEAILLRSHPYSDHSRILRFLTRQCGVVSLVGKGVVGRGPRGRGSTAGSAAFESFAEGVVTFHQRPDRDLHTLRGFERTSGPLRLGGDLRRLAGASFLAEILLTHTLEEGDADLYAWVRRSLERIGSAPDEGVMGWVLSASWRTLAFLGFDPELERCVSCGRPGDGVEGRPVAGEMGRFDTGGGGFRCPDCSRGTELPRLGPRARADLLRLVQGDPPDSGPEGVTGHLRILESFAEHHLAPPRGFRSLAVLRRALVPAGGPPSAPSPEPDV